MAVTYQITQSNKQLYTFNPTLDGVSYNAIVPWNLFGQRYYLNITNTGGKLIANVPLISSSTDTAYAPINLVAGIFTTSKVYYYASNNIIIVA